VTFPTMRCKGLCQDQCTIVPMTAAEVARLQEASGMVFDLWPANANHPDQFVITPPVSNRCPALGDDGRCRGYEGRPALRRIYGMTQALRCRHGCEPSRWLTDQECGRDGRHRPAGGCADQRRGGPVRMGLVSRWVRSFDSDHLPELAMSSSRLAGGGSSLLR